MSRHLDSATRVIAGIDPDLSARFGEPQQCVAAITSEVASRSGADFPVRDQTSDVVLRAIGVQRDSRTIEHHQQLGLVRVKSSQQPVQRDEAGAAEKDAIEAGGGRLVTALGGSQLVSFQIGVKVPDWAAKRTNAATSGQRALAAKLPTERRDLREISTRVSPGAHAILICDGAGWHQTGDGLKVPDNVTLLHLPPYAPELNSMENVSEYLHGNKLSRLVWDRYPFVPMRLRHLSPGSLDPEDAEGSPHSCPCSPHRTMPMGVPPRAAAVGVPDEHDHGD
jgi:hypothetical protein